MKTLLRCESIESHGDFIEIKFLGITAGVPVNLRVGVNAVLVTLISENHSEGTCDVDLKGTTMTGIPRSLIRVEADELAIEKFRRMASWLDFEYETMLQDLPSIAAIEEFFNLWAYYDTDLSDGIMEIIDDGANPIAWNMFVRKFNLDLKGWKVFE